MTETPGTQGPIDHEIDAGGIVKVGVWLAVVTIVSFLIGWGFYRALERGERRADAPPSPIAEANQPVVPAGPRLQGTPEIELADFRESEDRVLEGWGWVDRPAGIAHVPVDVAIERVAADAALPTFSLPYGSPGQ